MCWTEGCVERKGVLNWRFFNCGVWWTEGFLMLNCRVCWTKTCVELSDVLNWGMCWTEGCVELMVFRFWTDGFWGLKRSNPFVLNWCVELRETRSGLINKVRKLLFCEFLKVILGFFELEQQIVGLPKAISGREVISAAVTNYLVKTDMTSNLRKSEKIPSCDFQWPKFQNIILFYLQAVEWDSGGSFTLRNYREVNKFQNPTKFKFRSLTLIFNSLFYH